MATRKTTAKPKTEEKSEGVTLEQALKEEGEGRTPESIKNEGRIPDGPSKMDQATKIMEEMWDDIQAGKVKRKDVIQRFMEEVSLIESGAFHILRLNQEEALEHRLESIRDVLIAVIKPASAGLFIALSSF